MRITEHILRPDQPGKCAACKKETRHYCENCQKNFCAECFDKYHHPNTIERLEQIVDKTLAGTVPHKELLPAPEPAREKPAPVVTYPGVITRTAAWGIVILFLTVPLIAVMVPKPNLLWIIWVIVSGWAALDSRNIAAALSSPQRPVIAGSRMLVLSLAIVNLLTAIFAMFGPVRGLSGN